MVSVLIDFRDPTIEYFSVGHDRFHSLLEGFTDGWYNQASHQEPSSAADSDINLRRLHPKNLRELSFLFGGVGDGEPCYEFLFQAMDINISHNIMSSTPRLQYAYRHQLAAGPEIRYLCPFHTH